MKFDRSLSVGAFILCKLLTLRKKTLFLSDEPTDFRDVDFLEGWPERFVLPNANTVKVIILGRVH